MAVLLCHSCFEKPLKPDLEVTGASGSPVLSTVWGQCQIPGCKSQLCFMGVEHRNLTQDHFARKLRDHGAPLALLGPTIHLGDVEDGAVS